MRIPKLRELREAVKALVKGPYTSDYPRTPHVAYERFRGRPKFHEDDCIGCTACVQVCPAGALEFKDTVTTAKAARTLTVHWDICICCGQCQANCPTSRGIMLSTEYDYATTGRREDLLQSIEKELMLCDCCRQTVAPIDQHEWVAEKIGPLVFSNASLIISYLYGLALTLKDVSSDAHDPDKARGDRLKVLCPACRRQAVLKS